MVNGITRKILFISLFFTTLLTLNSCSTTSTSHTSQKKSEKNTSRQLPTQSQEPEEAQVEFGIDSHLSQDEKNGLLRIKAAHDQKNYQNVLSHTRQFFLQFPQSSALAQVYNYQGLAYYLLKQNDEATHSFRNALRIAKGRNIEPYILFNLASSLHEKEFFEDVLVESQQVNFSRLDPTTRFKFLRLLFYTHKKLAQPTQAIEALLRAEKSLNTSNNDLTFNNKQQLIQLEVPLHESLIQITDLSTLQDFYNKSQDSFFNSVFLFRVAELQFKSRNFTEAETLLTRFKNQHQESPFFRQVMDYLRTLEGQDKIEPQNIGVLLPMTGKFAPFGLQTLNGIEHALRIYEVETQNRGIKLIIEDSGDTKEQALKALDKLFFEHRVVAVIGPLLSRGINEVTQRAQDIAMPLISLSQQRGITGDYIFYASVTPQDQAEEIAQVAIQQKKMKRFAILYPKERFGESLANSFWNAVETLGGQIVAVETYTPSEPDFRDAVDKLIGTHYQTDRKLKLVELEKLRRKDNITKKTPKTERYYKLPPFVDYDAVFIPDEAKGVAQALPTFTYKDADQVNFLGISTWNSPLLTQRASREAQRSLFVDTFYAGSDNPQTNQFITSFKEEFGYAPTATEAFAYDSALILEKVILVLGSSAQRSSVRRLLSEVENHRGVTGNISTTKEGVMKRPLKVLTVRNGTIVGLD